MKDPLIFLKPYHGITERGLRYGADWADHHIETPFHRNSSEWVSQPYHLHDDAFYDFAILRAHGYHITIEGHSEHNPDCLTVRISGGPR